MANILGNNLLVYINNTPATGDKLLCSTNCTLNLEQAVTEASCKDAGETKWSNGIAGTASWSISTDGLYDSVLANDSFDALAAIIIGDANGTGTNSITVAFEVVDAVTPNVDYYSGTAILTSCSLNGPVDEFATWTAEFKGTGALAVTTVAA